MKVLWFILSLFVFTLSVTPCCTDECEDECELTCASTEHHGDEEEQRVCSPFCACEACGLYAFSTHPSQVVTFETINESPSDYIGNRYVFQFTSEFEVKIWQPPKFV